MSPEVKGSSSLGCLSSRPQGKACLRFGGQQCVPILIDHSFEFIDFALVGVAGSAVKWLRDTMKIISSAAEINDLAAKEETTGGVYFVTAFSGLLAPYWDPEAAGTLIGPHLLVLSLICVDGPN
jgi:glycerol kinase